MNLNDLRPTPPVAKGERAWPASVMNAYIDERNALLAGALKLRAEALKLRAECVRLTTQLAVARAGLDVAKESGFWQ